MGPRERLDSDSKAGQEDFDDKQVKEACQVVQSKSEQDKARQLADEPGLVIWR